MEYLREILALYECQEYDEALRVSKLWDDKCAIMNKYIFSMIDMDDLGGSKKDVNCFFKLYVLEDSGKKEDWRWEFFCYGYLHIYFVKKSNLVVGEFVCDHSKINLFSYSGIDRIMVIHEADAKSIIVDAKFLLKHIHPSVPTNLMTFISRVMNKHN